MASSSAWARCTSSAICCLASRIFWSASARAVRIVSTCSSFHLRRRALPAPARFPLELIATRAETFLSALLIGCGESLLSKLPDALGSSLPLIEDSCERFEEDVLQVER